MGPFFLREITFSHRLSHFKGITSLHLFLTVKFPSVPTMAWDWEDLAGSPLANYHKHAARDPGGADSSCGDLLHPPGGGGIGKEQGGGGHI